MTFDLGTWPFDYMNIWRFTYINKPSLVQIGLQLFKWGYFHIFSLGTSTFQMRPFSHFQPILQLDLRWPLTLIYDHWPHQQMTVPMLHLWSDSGWNPSEHVEDRAKCQPFFHNRQQITTDNRGQSDPYVSFLLRQATQKSDLNQINLIFYFFFFFNQKNCQPWKEVKKSKGGGRIRVGRKNGKRKEVIKKRDYRIGNLKVEARKEENMGRMQGSRQSSGKSGEWAKNWKKVNPTYHTRRNGKIDAGKGPQELIIVMKTIFYHKNQCCFQLLKLLIVYTWTVLARDILKFKTAISKASDIADSWKTTWKWCEISYVSQSIITRKSSLIER